MKVVDKCEYCNHMGVEDEDTLACEEFEDEEIIECDGRCLNCDYYDTSDCPDRK